MNMESLANKEKLKYNTIENTIDNSINNVIYPTDKEIADMKIQFINDPDNFPTKNNTLMSNLIHTRSPKVTNPAYIDLDKGKSFIVLYTVFKHMHLYDQEILLSPYNYLIIIVKITNNYYQLLLFTRDVNNNPLFYISTDKSKPIISKPIPKSKFKFIPSPILNPN